MKCEWKYSTIGQVCLLVTDGSHFSPQSVSDGQYMVSVKDFTAYGFNFSNCRQISDEDYQRLEKAGCVPEYEDVLVGKDGARYFEDIIVYRQAERPALLSSIAILRCDTKEILPDYLYYLMKNPTFKQDVRDNYGSGSAIPRIILKDFKRMPIKYPCIEEQVRIISILRSLDDKIELNNKINENLERQARALLTQWLIENDGAYEFFLLSDVAEINPDTYSPKNAWEFVNYLDTSSITDGIISEVQHIKPSTEKLPSRARRIIAANDVVFSTVRPNQRHFGIINDPLGNMLASTGFAVIRSNHPSVSNELLYLRLTEDSFIEKMQQLAEQSTSTFPSIKPSDLGCCEIPCPISQEIMKTLKAIFDSISNNQKQNEALSELRDTLLPKLMSGEISIDF